MASEEGGCNVIKSGLVPFERYLNAKARDVNSMLHDYFRNRMLTLLKHDNINAKTYCNISSLHLNGKSVTLFNENFCKLFKYSRFRELLKCLKI